MQQNHSSNTPGSANYQYGDYYYDRSGYAQQYQYYQQQCEEQPGVPPPPALEQTNSVEQPSQKPPPPPPPPPCEEDMELDTPTPEPAPDASNSPPTPPLQPSQSQPSQPPIPPGTATNTPETEVTGYNNQSYSQYQHQQEPAGNQQWGYQDHNQYGTYANSPVQSYAQMNAYHHGHGSQSYRYDQYYSYYQYGQHPMQQGYYPQYPHPASQATYGSWNQHYSSPVQTTPQRIVRTKETDEPSDPPQTTEQEPRWQQPQYPQWEGHTGNYEGTPPAQKDSTPRGRGRGMTGRRWGQAPGRQSRWDIPSDQQNADSPKPSSNEQVEKNVLTPATPTNSSTGPISDPRALDSSQWPPKLRDYLMRSFESCSSDSDRDHVEQYLKVEISAMFEDKRVWQIDWDKEPLPLDKIKRQGQKRKSRWDTPSPSADIQKRLSPPIGSVGHWQQQQQQQPVGGEEGLGRGRGRGRGKKNKWKQAGRGKFFIDRTGRGGGTYRPLSEEDRAKVDLRSQRFAKGSEGNKTFKPKMSLEQLMKTVCVSGDEDWRGCNIEGTSQAIEKKYLRLTSAPDPSTVRPEDILVKSMDFVLSRWNTSNDYRYACEQFKSIRQDLTIQGIRNDFTVEVYETHARIALQNGDWGEFNQCQSQLRLLYVDGIRGHKAEFMSYRILYHMMTNESADLVQILTEVTDDLVSDSAVNHALKLRKAWSSGNYYRFFQLYPDTPHYGRHLVDLFLERQKKVALKTLSKAYRPTLSVEYISRILGFSSDSDCVDFLINCDAVLNEGRTGIDCKLTHDKLSK